jgi:hypothetical protein
MAEFVKKDGTVIVAAELERPKPALHLTGFINGTVEGWTTEINHESMTTRAEVRIVVYLSDLDPDLDKLRNIIHPGALVKISPL